MVTSFEGAPLSVVRGTKLAGMMLYLLILFSAAGVVGVVRGLIGLLCCCVFWERDLCSWWAVAS